MRRWTSSISVSLVKVLDVGDERVLRRLLGVRPGTRSGAVAVPAQLEDERRQVADEGADEEEHEEGSHGRNYAIRKMQPPVADVPPHVDFLPILLLAVSVLRDVAVVVLDGVSPFELGVLCEVFGIDRSDDGLPPFDFAVCSPGGRPVGTSTGFGLVPQHGLDRLASADLVAVPALPRGSTPPPVLCALRDAAARGARVLSVCSGAFVLGEAGLLDGRRCTTHWRHAAELAALYPAAAVDPNVLYVEDGPVVTSAGTAAGIDACLHVLRAEFGARVAGAVARRMVVPPHREGGQAQFVETPVPAQPADSLQPLLEWLLGHLDVEHTVEQLAARALLSPRTFARRFKDETGTTPHAWLSARRVDLAQRMLEETDLPVEHVAATAGFGGAAAMRHHFTQLRGTTPQAYRRAFRGLRAGSCLPAGAARSGRSALT